MKEQEVQGTFLQNVLKKLQGLKNTVFITMMYIKREGKKCTRRIVTKSLS